jgi:hypothetical protein
MLITIGSSMNAKYFARAAITVMLIGATALSTTDNAFAGKKKYEKSQAASQVNECGNGELPLNVFCQNLLSQIQGDGNAVNVIGVQ